MRDDPCRRGQSRQTLIPLLPVSSRAELFNDGARINCPDLPENAGSFRERAAISPPDHQIIGLVDGEDGCVSARIPTWQLFFAYSPSLCALSVLSACSA